MILLFSFFDFLFKKIFFLGNDTVNHQNFKPIFERVGFLTVIISVVMALLFYKVLPSIRKIWVTLNIWRAFAAVATIIGIGLAVFEALSQTGLSFYLYMGQFAALNGILALVVFVSVSYLIKNTPFSPFVAKSIPCDINLFPWMKKKVSKKNKK
ncbi:MAG: hypothetical protein U0T69_10840 [Chitinophagales bacterium]